MLIEPDGAAVDVLVVRDRPVFELLELLASLAELLPDDDTELAPDDGVELVPDVEGEDNSDVLDWLWLVVVLLVVDGRAVVSVGERVDEVVDCEPGISALADAQPVLGQLNAPEAVSEILDVTEVDVPGLEIVPVVEVVTVPEVPLDVDLVVLDEVKLLNPGVLELLVVSNGVEMLDPGVPVLLDDDTLSVWTVELVVDIVDVEESRGLDVLLLVTSVLLLLLLLPCGRVLSSP